MAIVKPFRAIRPSKDKAPFVITRSYEDYSKKEREATLLYNPFSFLHILNPGFKFDKRIRGPKRFKLVYNRYLEFLEDRILVKDTDACFYLYRVEKGNYCCSGLFCATSVEDYRKGVIKKHEATLKKREELFADYLETVKFNAEPVLITYEDRREIAEILAEQAQKAPEYHFTTPDGVTHKLWLVSDQNGISRLQDAFATVRNLYIADGHHRSASSELLARRQQAKNSEHEGLEAYNFFMSYLIPESEIRIYEFNRMIKGLNGLTKEAFLMKLDEYYRITNKRTSLYKPTKKHHFSMYLEGEFYSLFLRKKVYRFTDALSRLDTQILYKTVLEPILGIKDLRNDQRIRYGFGKHSIINMKDEIDSGNFTVGFGLVPVSVSEIKAIADEGQVMPPKSTYIEPKLRSGMTIYEL